MGAMHPSSGRTSPLRRKLLWLIGVRFVTVTILLGSGMLVQFRTPGLWPVGPFFFLVGLSYAVAIVFLLTLAHVERRRWLIDVQLATDAFVISGIVLLTGGVSSYFSTLYALPIIGASILQFRRGGLLVGALSALLYAGVVVGQYQGRSSSSRRGGPRSVSCHARPRCWRSAWPVSTSSGSWPWRRSAAILRSGSGAPTRVWRVRRPRSPTSRRSTSTSSRA